MSYFVYHTLPTTRVGEKAAKSHFTPLSFLPLTVIMPKHASFAGSKAIEKDILFIRIRRDQIKTGKHDTIHFLFRFCSQWYGDLETMCRLEWKEVIAVALSTH